MTQRHKTAVIVGTLTKVTNYPKLRIYLNNASPYWQVVYWDKGMTYRRSSKTKDKLEAIRFAKTMYEEILVNKYQNKTHMRGYANVKVDVTSKARLTFKEVAEAWLIRKAPNWVAKHTNEVTRRLTHNIYPYIGNKAIHKITKLDMLEVIQKIEARGAGNIARRVLNDCKQIWHYAMVIDACKYDATIGLNAALHSYVRRHQITIAIEELPALMSAINLYNADGDLIIRYALQMIAHTFVRKNELLLAKWHEFDLDKRIWKIPADRMKMRVEHQVPLTLQTIEILAKVRRAYPSNHYVFNDGDEYKTLRDHALITALYKIGYKNKMCVHGFRALASTILNENNFRVDVIEKQLAHAESNQVRRAYNHAQYMNERILMMEWWSNHLVNLNNQLT
jgi:integrase